MVDGAGGFPLVTKLERSVKVGAPYFLGYVGERIGATQHAGGRIKHQRLHIPTDILVAKEDSVSVPHPLCVLLRTDDINLISRATQDMNFEQGFEAIGREGSESITGRSARLHIEYCARGGNGGVVGRPCPGKGEGARNLVAVPCEARVLACKGGTVRDALIQVSRSRVFVGHFEDRGESSEVRIQAQGGNVATASEESDRVRVASRPASLGGRNVRRARHVDVPEHFIPVSVIDGLEPGLQCCGVGVPADRIRAVQALSLRDKLVRPRRFEAEVARNNRRVLNRVDGALACARDDGADHVVNISRLLVKCHVPDEPHVRQQVRHQIARDRYPGRIDDRQSADFSSPIGHRIALVVLANVDR